MKTKFVKGMGLAMALALQATTVAPMTVQAKEALTMQYEPQFGEAEEEVLKKNTENTTMTITGTLIDNPESLNFKGEGNTLNVQFNNLPANYSNVLHIEYEATLDNGYEISINSLFGIRGYDMIKVWCEKDDDVETSWDYAVYDGSGAWSAPLQNGVTYDIANMYINPVLKYYDIIEQMVNAGATESDICSSLPIEFEGAGWANAFDPSEHQIVTAQMYVGIMYDAEILYGNSWGYYFSKDDTEEVPDETIEVEDSTTAQDMKTEEESLIESMQQEMSQETIVPDVTVVVVEGDLVYTVKAGDTLGSISANYYGNNSKGSAIREHNKEVFAINKGKLVEGMRLVLPAKLGSKTRIAEPVANEGEALYTVMHGDTLCGIAKKIYGTEAKLAELYARNSDRLSDASKLFPGQVIVLPAK